VPITVVRGLIENAAYDANAHNWEKARCLPRPACKVVRKDRWVNAGSIPNIS
jgi:hypothetical protein